MSQGFLGCCEQSSPGASIAAVAATFMPTDHKPCWYQLCWTRLFVCSPCCWPSGLVRSVKYCNRMLSVDRTFIGCKCDSCIQCNLC